MIKAENKFILAQMLKRWDKKGRVNDAKKAEILETIDRIGAKVTYATSRMLNFRADFERMNVDEGGRGTNLEMELNKVANDFDDLFKVL